MTAEARLLEYRGVVESSPDLICVLDTSYRLVLANASFSSAWRVPPEQATGRTAAEVLGPAAFALLKPRFDDCLGGREVSFEMSPGTPGTGPGDLSVLCTPLREGDAVTRIVCVMRDVSSKRRLEGQLLHAQRMEAVGQLAGGVAHDFNNVLSVILGYCRLLETDMAGDDRQLERLGQVIAAAERAAQLTRALLAFSRKQAMAPREANLNDVVQRVQKLLVRIIGEDVHLRSVTNEVDLPVFVDAGHVEQVLVNLATNARDAMPRGGALTIETGVRTIDPAFVAQHGFGDEGRYALLRVSDSGGGMDEETRKRVFEPFFTTKEPGKGTGLGMSIVYGIVKQHRGFITVSSEQGNGTVVSVYLPLLEGDRAVRESPAAPPAVQGGTETILVAEDDAGVRRLLSTVLSEAGYEVILAEDGEAAVEAFRANPDRVRLVLMDLVMPKQSGTAACEAIRLLRPDVKVLFSSGYSTDLIETRGHRVEAAEVLVKPVQPVDLLRKVRETLDR